MTDTDLMAQLEQSIPPLTSGGSLAEQVRDALLAAINSGALAPGTRLREIPLSEHFGLSKTPVREGLRLLEAEGVVHVVPRRGAVVASLDPEAIRHLYEFRLILECAAARRAAARGASPTHLRALHREMAGALDEDTSARFHQLDVELHREIGTMSGNPELADAVARIHQRIQAARQRSAVVARLKVAHRQHGRLIAAIRAKDPDRAAECMAEHIESACDHVLSHLTQD